MLVGVLVGTVGFVRGCEVTAIFSDVLLRILLGFLCSTDVGAVMVNVVARSEKTAESS